MRFLGGSTRVAVCSAERWLTTLLRGFAFFCVCGTQFPMQPGTTTKELMGWLVSGDFAAIVIMYLLIASRSYVCPEPTAKTFGGRARRASACECR